MNRNSSPPNRRAWPTRYVLNGLAAAMLFLSTTASAQQGGNCTAAAGTLRGFKPTDCLQDGGTLIGAISNGGQVVPAGYQVLFVLTKGQELVIQAVSNNPIFNVQSTGFYTIHRLVYNPNTLDLSIVQFGTTTGFDVNSLLIQGGGSICAALDVEGTSILVDDPSAGALVATDADVCLESGAAILNATFSTQPYVPAGYTTLHVLTQGPELVIIDAGPEPSFTVSTPGSYTIHTLVYDPATLGLGAVQFGTSTGFDVNGLLIQGGGAICAALDVPGAAFTVTECNEPCTAFAGTLRGFKPTDCLQDGGTVIGAISNGDQVVPAGYQVLYVLTSGSDLVIQAVSSNPFFTVTSTGTFTVHRLVYDPSTLDLGIVQFGTTTGGDVNALLVQGGGSICASLDVAGARIIIDNPDAGSLEASNSDACLQNGSASLDAVVATAPYVPEGYNVAYVLTQGPGLVIVNAGAEPSFTVNAEGTYTIHTLVYDPNTLDLGIVQLGVTTGFDVNSLLIQGGGTICASLDVPGAAFTVTACNEPCIANAGTLSANTLENLCLEAGSATLAATPNGDAVVPDGYSLLYVLTSGPELTIQNVAPTPNFSVSSEGLYTIHTLVYDAATLDLSVVVPGQTTGVDVLNLVVENGICASLDVPGAPFNVSVCEEPCTANAGTLTANTLENLCLEAGSASLAATPNGDAVVPAGYTLLYVLTSGQELTIQNVAPTPNFSVSSEGLYTIHTLVYDAATLDLSVVVPGQTTGVDVLTLVVENGICASLDVPGAPFFVEACAGNDIEVLGWPTIAKEEMWVSVSGAEQRVEMGVFTLRGEPVMPLRAVPSEESLQRLDLSDLAPGTYLLRVVSGDSVVVRRFVRAD